jgi:hypothetical protein
MGRMKAKGLPQQGQPQARPALVPKRPGEVEEEPGHLPMPPQQGLPAMTGPQMGQVRKRPPPPPQVKTYVPPKPVQAKRKPPQPGMLDIET